MQIPGPQPTSCACLGLEAQKFAFQRAAPLNPSNSQACLTQSTRLDPRGGNLISGDFIIWEFSHGGCKMALIGSLRVGAFKSEKLIVQNDGAVLFIGQNSR